MPLLAWDSDVIVVYIRTQSFNHAEDVFILLSVEYGHLFTDFELRHLRQ